MVVNYFFTGAAPVAPGGVIVEGATQFGPFEQTRNFMRSCRCKFTLILT